MEAYKVAARSIWALIAAILVLSMVTYTGGVMLAQAQESNGTVSNTTVDAVQGQAQEQATEGQGDMAVNETMGPGANVTQAGSGAVVVERVSLGEKYCKRQAVKKYGLFDTGPYDRVTEPRVYYIRVEGIIDFAMAEYIQLAIQKAEQDNAVLVVMLNTPGGFLDAALEIVSIIDDSRVPVIGYVVDRWAESAGTLILVTSHVAAMQPGTIIGSVQPVAYDPTTGAYAPVNESKIINPIIEVFCEHGATKGRNATALVRFVLYNDNYGAEEALQYHVIDLVARDLNDLARQLDGKIVALPSGDRVLLDLENPRFEEVQPTVRIRLVHFLSDPMLSGLLMSLGMLILLFSIVSGNLPSAAIGALLLLLGLAGSGFNPNTASLILILAGSLLLFIEIYTPGFGIIGGTGIVMLVFGIAMLPLGGEGFSISPEYGRQLLAALYSTGAFVGVLTAFIVYKVVQARKAKPIVWEITGARGRAVDKIGPGRPGFVMVEGEYWKAVSDEEIEPGEEVEIVEKLDYMVKVRPVRDRRDRAGQGGFSA